MKKHSIQLASPWLCASEGQQDWTRVNLPLTGTRSGPLRLQRPFGWPASLDSRERVWLVIEGLSGEVEIWLNEESLEVVDGADRLRVDITDEMATDNWLSVWWKGDDPGGLAGPVWLECVSE